MASVELQQRIEELLTARGIAVAGMSGSGPPRGGAGEDAYVAWEVFREVARERFGQHAEDCDDDMLLFSGYWGSAVPAAGWGWAPDGTERAAFILSFSRTITVYNVDGDRDDPETLTLRIQFDGDSNALLADDHLFGYAGPVRSDVSNETHPEISEWAGHADIWVAQVERSNSFRAFDVLSPSNFLLYRD